MFKRTAFAIAATASALVCAMPGSASAHDAMTEITSPTAGEYVIDGDLELRAHDTTGSTLEPNWAVRSQDCSTTTYAANGPNVGAWNDPYQYTSGEFTADIDVSSWAAGTYCFVFNPAAPNDEHRTTVTFTIATPEGKSACKDGGYATYGFSNQGQCVSYFQAAEPAGK